MTDYQDDQYLDCKGLNCPLPILKTKKALDGINSGEILKMVATDPGSVNDGQAFTRRTRYHLLESIAENGEFTFYISKS